MNDMFKTIEQPGEGYITEKKSKFISHIFPVKTTDEVKHILDEYRKIYYNARHICWAYVLGWERADFRSNDDGEPSGTAGKPILGQINSVELTDVLLLVVRYFGGTLLGTGGLIKAYREAAANAIANTQVIEKTVDDVIDIRFDYLLLNDVMRVLKQFESVQWTQNFTENCHMRLQIRRSLSLQLAEMLSSIHGVTVHHS
jgi:Uncharacterized conserved protein